MARTGDHFWSFEEHGVIPDIMVIAKGMGNGFPLGAVIAKREQEFRHALAIMA